MCLWKDCQQQQLSRLLRIATKTVLKTTTIKPCGCPPLLEDHKDKLPAGAKRQQLTSRAQPPPRRRRRTARQDADDNMSEASAVVTTAGHTPAPQPRREVAKGGPDLDPDIRAEWFIKRMEEKQKGKRWR